METRYGRKETYQYELDRERLEWLTIRTNRSLGQTQFLFQLVDGEFGELVFLEEQLKNNFIFYSPGSKDEVKRVLEMNPEKKWFNV